MYFLQKYILIYLNVSTIISLILYYSCLIENIDFDEINNSILNSHTGLEIRDVNVIEVTRKYLSPA